MDILSIAKFSIKQTVDNKPVTNTLKVICNIAVNPPVVRLVHCGTWWFSRMMRQTSTDGGWGVKAMNKTLKCGGGWRKSTLRSLTVQTSAVKGPHESIWLHKHYLLTASDIATEKCLESPFWIMSSTSHITTIVIINTTFFYRIVYIVANHPDIEERESKRERRYCKWGFDPRTPAWRKVSSFHVSKLC